MKLKIPKELAGKWKINHKKPLESIYKNTGQKPFKFCYQPDHLWAKLQLYSIFSLHDIERGGPAGNNALINWAYLYSDAFEDKDDQEDDELDTAVKEVIERIEEEVAG